MCRWRDQLIRLANALGVSAALFAVTFFLLAPTGSRRGKAMEGSAPLSGPTTLLLPSAAPALPAPALPAPADAEEFSAEAAYWGNRGTLVFHLPGCPSLSRTEENRRVPFSDRQSALDAGYAPCGRCHP